MGRFLELAVNWLIVAQFNFDEIKNRLRAVLFFTTRAKTTNIGCLRRLMAGKKELPVAIFINQYDATGFGMSADHNMINFTIIMKIGNNLVSVCRLLFGHYRSLLLIAV